MKFEKPMNIQLFAESEDSSNAETSQNQETSKNSKQNDTVNTVPKDLFDKSLYVLGLIHTEGSWISYLFAKEKQN